MAQSRPLKSPSLTREDFIDFQRLYARNERAILERSLDTFLQVYSEEKQQFNEHISKHGVNDSSKTFLLAIRFLRNFKSHNRELGITNPDNQVRLRKEVLGLMASILQVIMNAKKLSKNKKKRLRDIFLGDEMRNCLKERELQNDHFEYKFPKLFLERNIIKGNWFTEENAKELACFSSSNIQTDISEFVTGCFVHLYDEHLAATYSSAEYEIAVRKLQENLSQEINADGKATDSDKPRRKRKRDQRK